MRAIVAEEPGRIAVVDDIPMPHIEDYECLVKIRASGFCNGTDLKIIHGKAGTMTTPFPAVIGHEPVGEVVEVGAKVRSWSVGDRMINPSFRLEPGTRYNSMWGGMSEYAVVTDWAVKDELGLGKKPVYTGCLRIPHDIPFEDGAVILSLKETLSAVRNFGFRAGMDALVYGDGPMGLALVQFLRMEGAGWVGCVGHWDERLAKSVSIGKADAVVNSHTRSVPDWMGDRRVDLVIDAVGSTSIVEEASGLVKKGGKVGLTGVLSPGHSSLDLLSLPHHTCVHVLSFPYREHDVHDEIAQMIVDGRIDPKNYYSHVLPIDQAEEAMRLVVSREAFKVVLTM